MTTSDSYLLLRDLHDAVSNDQPFMWQQARRAGADLRMPGGDEVLGLLLEKLGHTAPAVPPDASPVTGPDVPGPKDSWMEQALDEVLQDGVRMNPRTLMTLYRAGRTTVLARLLAQEPCGIDGVQRALLLCQAALVRERAPLIDGTREPGLFHVVEERRHQLLAGLARWGLPTEVHLDPVSVASDAYFFHLGRISLYALDGAEGLTAFHTPAVHADPVRNPPQAVVLYVADHWLGPRDVLNPAVYDDATLLANRRRFAVQVERLVLQAGLDGSAVPSDHPVGTTAGRPRL